MNMESTANGTQSTKCLWPTPIFLQNFYDFRYDTKQWRYDDDDDDLGVDKI